MRPGDKGAPIPPRARTPLARPGRPARGGDERALGLPGRPDGGVGRLDRRQPRGTGRAGDGGAADGLTGGVSRVTGCRASACYGGSTRRGLRAREASPPPPPSARSRRADCPWPATEQLGSPSLPAGQPGPGWPRSGLRLRRRAIVWLQHPAFLASATWAARPATPAPGSFWPACAISATSKAESIQIEWRHDDGETERLPELAAELVRLKPDVIVVGNTPPAVAAKQATSTIPIVFMAVSDPVGTGLVATLGPPRGQRDRAPAPSPPS